MKKKFVQQTFLGKLMTVYPLLTNFVKLYSKGIEKKYNGVNIEYENETNTFLFFYYSSFTRVYVINGAKNDFQLVQVKEKINRIAIYDYVIAKRFIRFFNEVSRREDFLFYIPPLFFREILPLLNQKNYIKNLGRLYNKYKEDIKNGMTFSII